MAYLYKFVAPIYRPINTQQDIASTTVKQHKAERKKEKSIVTKVIGGLLRTHIIPDPTASNVKGTDHISISISTYIYIYISDILSKKKACKVIIYII